MIQDIDSVNEIKVILRDVILHPESYKLSHRKFSLSDFGSIFYVFANIRRRNILRKISKIGGVLTGSNVLTHTYINGQITRDNHIPSDWDILITEDKLYELTNFFKFEQHGSKLTYQITAADEYGHGAVDIDVILVDELPSETYEVSGIKVVEPFGIISRLLEYNRDKDKQFLREFFWGFRHKK